MKVDTGCVVPPWWDDKPLAIVGCGPSLAGFDHARFCDPRWRVLAVASAVWQLPRADALYDQDSVWIEVHAPRLCAITDTELYLCWPPSRGRAECPRIDSAIWIEGQRGDGQLAELATRVEMSFTSGFGALGIAKHKRARRIALFGYDYREDGPRQHSRDADYPWHMPPGVLDQKWPAWARKFDRIVPQLRADGIEIICASPESNVRAFQRCTAEEGLAFLGRSC